MEKKRILLISHSKKDEDYIQEIVNLLEYIGLREGDMVCSSSPDYGIPYGNDIFEWLKSVFNDYELHVLFVLSHNFYSSVPCLNEMGAAWVLGKNYDFILLPGFDFSDIEGAINKNKIGIKIDADNVAEIKKKLGQLKNILVDEFELKNVSEIGWEKTRDSFIDKMNSIEEKIFTNGGADGLEDVTISYEAGLLLLYAANSSDGTLTRLSLLAGVCVTAGNYCLNRDNSPREEAIWDGAIEELELMRLIKATSFKREVFKVTNEGYITADIFHVNNPNIDISFPPSSYL